MKLDKNIDKVILTPKEYNILMEYKKMAEDGVKANVEITVYDNDEDRNMITQIYFYCDPMDADAVRFKRKLQDEFDKSLDDYYKLNTRWRDDIEYSRFVDSQKEQLDKFKKELRQRYQSFVKYYLTRLWSRTLKLFNK